MDASIYDTIKAKEAIVLQKELREKVELKPLDSQVKTVGGADISYNKFSEVVFAGIVVLSIPDLQVIERVAIKTATSFPYIPGLLAFREIPAIIEAWNSLSTKPDLLVFDGHGIAHPRRVGIASHFGILADVPTLGCAKTVLTGKFQMPDNEQFAESPLTDKEEILGSALRTKRNCKPIFISAGHHITLKESVEIIKSSTGKYRIPEPTRLAHLLVNESRRNDNPLKETLSIR